MKNKNYIKLIMFLMLLLISGCGKLNETLDSNNLDNNQNIEHNFISYQWNCDIELNEIKDFSLYKNLFITNDGKLYEYSFDKKFSNEKHCKKIDTELLFTRFIYGGIIAKNGSLYIYYENKLLKGSYSDPNAVLMTNPNLIIRLLNENSNIFAFPKYDNYANPDYAYVEDNNLYIRYFGADGNFKLVKTFKDGEEYIGSYGVVIKTNKNYYIQSVINKKECMEYVDIDCKYDINEVPNIDFKNIEYFNGKHIIYKDDNKLYYYE